MYISYSFTTFHSQQQQFQDEDGRLVLGAPRARRVLVHHNPNSYLHQDLWDRPGKVVNGASVQDGWLEAASVEFGSSSPLSPTVTSSCVVGLASSSSAKLSHARKLHINSLPPELLTTIFLYCLSPPSSHRSDLKLHQPTPNNAPLLLCRVCSFWRRLAKATPFLWRELDLGDVRPKMQRPNRQPSFELQPPPQQRAFEYLYPTLDTVSETDPPINTHHDVIAYSEIPPMTSAFLIQVLNTDVGHRKRSLSRLSSLTHLFATLSRPLSMKSLKMKVSRYRVDGVKTDFERLSIGFSDMLDQDGGGGEVVDVLSSTSGSGTIIPQVVLENVLFGQNGFVAQHVASLDLTLDEPADIPRITIFVPPRSTSATSTPFRAQFGLPTLRRLILRMHHLSLADFEWPPWVGPVHTQLKGVVDLLKFGWGFIPAVHSSSFDDNDDRPLGVEPTADETATLCCEGDEGWTTAFSLPSVVPNLEQVELDSPWITLFPGRYGTRGLSLYPSLTSSLLPSPSILPYAQLQSLTLVRPIPVWILRALLVECLSLKAAHFRLLALSPNFDQDDALQQVGVDGGANGEGDGDVTQRADSEYGVYWERVCRRAFGGDPVELALADSDHGDTSAHDHETQLHGLSLDALEELHLTIQCSPQIDDRLLTDRLRRVEQERWPNLDVVFPLPPPFHPNLRPEPSSLSSWMEALRSAVEPSETEAGLVNYALRGFELPNLKALYLTPYKA